MSQAADEEDARTIAALDSAAAALRTEKLTQKEQAQVALAELRQLLPALEALRKKLRDVVGAAQNGPPDGEADGSIDNQDWYAYREVAEGLKALSHAVERASNDR